ncbi:hypothetical protein A3I27_04325 [Candidatus Giovannonibacteria bacterium RIFCSPLOWO2_02_FULL_43_11b]|uniref:Peptidase S9 prolyl oligopeptidase catalytic domain-containing protein n=1 Tax=Candidatus Nomurabacteria bacterium RIFCSPLOWO2_12_FULL_46_14 TaxID=1801797 RepID=A0A1F6YD86_9BACT|nr:MAG: hypothetical protein A2739_02290 [Candidatus Giovannonibacteria bacterium RIFCSPHIGHO2_01_FULL_43_100]OGF66636.1 MAG: hypothetical protein A3B97_03985 [Candidatus Giovannonibacteria bacterium RIFCSPHIGHO2_02_FULL_43_32]OGF78631.1 MAG: hypothetical protein A3A15_01245 [Candidatus Giovannonibacteria bacterium RIFCSPLOWO2_01_FULL_43_60]OGF90102.1 MAG: hypothetical protein A3I27_04325 [Candidatus Giovannonibacteria bacterium RIFCSPLOWO2_02_FULL_43_11b]OGJ04270.1 MAG: hypothetical protein A3
MILDHLYTAFNFRNRQESDITLENIETKFNKKFYYQPNSSGLCCFVSGWGENLAHTKKIRALFWKKGYSFAEYQLPLEILSANHQRTLEFFKTIRDIIKKDIFEHSVRNQFSRIELMGVSLGAVMACLVANNNNLINKLYLLVPGNSLAESLWLGIRTQNLKKEFEKQGINLEQLENYWHDLAPQNNLNFPQSQICLVLSQADGIIPFSCGQKLVESMQQTGLRPEVKINRFFGHYGTMAAIYLFPNRFLELVNLPG